MQLVCGSTCLESALSQPAKLAVPAGALWLQSVQFVDSVGRWAQDDNGLRSWDDTQPEVMHQHVHGWMKQDPFLEETVPVAQD